MGIIAATIAVVVVVIVVVETQNLASLRWRRRVTATVAVVATVAVAATVAVMATGDGNG